MGRYCENCGAPMTETENYCQNCGAPNRRKKYCENCGAPITDSEGFCQNCGAPISAPPSGGYSPSPPKGTVHSPKSTAHWLFGVLGGVVLIGAVVGTLFLTGVIGGHTQQPPGQTGQQAYQSTSMQTQALPQGTGSAIPIEDMVLDDLQGEWRGVGRLVKLENIEKYEWNWEVLSAEEAALYNSMLNIDNIFYFTIDQYNDVGYELLAENTGWRGLADTLYDVTLTNGELYAQYDDYNFQCQVYATISRDTDGLLIIQGTVEAVIIQGGAYGVEKVEIPYEISFSVKQAD